MTAPSRPLVAELLPELAAEMERLLFEDGEADLAAQIPKLRIVDRCRCGESFCSTFYVQPPPSGAYGPSHYNVVIDPKAGMIVLDVVDGKIACVEVLYRDDVRAAIDQH